MCIDRPYFFLPGLGFCYSVIQGPTNATVLAGSEARFNCTVSLDWVILIWLSNGNPVLTVTSAYGPVLGPSDRFTSQNYTSSSGVTLELIIHNTQLSDSGKIECSTQQFGESGFAFLSVQGVYKPPIQSYFIILHLKESSDELLKWSLWKNICSHLLFFVFCPSCLSFVVKASFRVTSRVPLTRVITALVFFLLNLSYNSIKYKSAWKLYQAHQQSAKNDRLVKTSMD